MKASEIAQIMQNGITQGIQVVQKRRNQELQKRRLDQQDEQFIEQLAQNKTKYEAELEIQSERAHTLKKKQEFTEKIYEEKKVGAARRVINGLFPVVESTDKESVKNSIIGIIKGNLEDLKGLPEEYEKYKKKLDQISPGSNSLDDTNNKDQGSVSSEPTNSLPQNSQTSALSTESTNKKNNSENTPIFTTAINAIKNFPFINSLFSEGDK